MITLSAKTVFSKLETFKKQLIEHQFFKLAKEGEVSRELLNEFAFHQYSDSILWIPMLAQMKEKAVKSKILRKSIIDNICCESGVSGTSHVQLAVNLMRNLGVKSLEKMPAAVFGQCSADWLSDDFAMDFNEPEVAGFLLGAETLVPIMFAMIKPAYDLLGIDTSYFSEHIEVDSDEHSQWMTESVKEIISIYGNGCVKQIINGMISAKEETFEVPDMLLTRIK